MIKAMKLKEIIEKLTESGLKVGKKQPAYDSGTYFARYPILGFGSHIGKGNYLNINQKKPNVGFIVKNNQLGNFFIKQDYGYFITENFDKFINELKTLQSPPTL